MEKLQVVITERVNPATGEIDLVPLPDQLYEMMAEAGWGDDPGQGKAIILPNDGREVLNPMMVAPPIGYEQEPSVVDRVYQMIAAKQRLLEDGDVIDESEEEALDFDVPDPEDIFPESIYEIQMVPEVPEIPRTPRAEEDKVDPVSDASADGVRSDPAS